MDFTVQNYVAYLLMYVTLPVVVIAAVRAWREAGKPAPPHLRRNPRHPLNETTGESEPRR
jgi:hypothetical protein